MVNCQETPLQLPDGRTLQPSAELTLEDFCQLFPVLLDMELEARAQQAPGRGRPVPGQNVSVVQGPNVPAGFRQPGGLPVPGQSQMSPFGGPPSQVAAGGGSGFVASGGGRAGQRGMRGATGPPGPGTIEAPITKTDGDFSVASGSPFVAVPGTEITFATSMGGTAIFFLQAVFGSVAEESRGQIGLRIDGTDYPLSANQTGAAVDDFLKTVTSFWPLFLALGSHTVEVVIRGDESLAPPSAGLPVTVQANEDVPLSLAVIHL